MLLFMSYTTLHQGYLRKTSDVASLLEPTSDFTGPERTTEEGQVNWMFYTNARVAILPLPVPHTRPPLNSSPTHSFPLFLSLEKTPHLRNHWGCFLKVPVWQSDRGHHSAFSLIWKDQVKFKRGSSSPSLKTLSTPPSLTTPHPTIPASAWVDSLSWFSDLPCLCDTNVIVRGWQRTGSLGVDRAGLKVSSISLCMMDAARGPGHLKCTKQDGAKQNLLGPFTASALSYLLLPLTHSHRIFTSI